jgi:hypothetical protein
VSGKQYRSWIFPGFETAERQLGYFVDNFPSVFSWIAIGLMVIGLWKVLSKSGQISWFILLLIIVCVGYSINYDIHDIDSYFLLAYVGVGLLLVFGLHALLDRIHGQARYVLAIALVVLPVFEFLSHKEMVDESDNMLVDDYARTALNALDSNAVVFTYQWDYFVSAAYYLQHVENIRTDVTIVDKELLRRSWYFIQLRNNVPWLVQRSEATIDEFLAELYKFEHGQQYHGTVIEARFNAMVNSLVDSSMSRGPVYLGAEMEPQFAGAYERVPEGLFLRILPPGTAKTLGTFDPGFRNSRFRSRLTAGLKIQYAKMLTLRAIWQIKSEGQTIQAKTSLRRALEIDPTYAPAVRLLRTLPD